EGPMKKVRGTLDDVWPIVLTSNTPERRVNVYVELKGTPYTLFVDLNGAPLKPVMASNRPPHMVVEKAPGQFECYWKILGMTSEHQRAAQRTLIEIFDGNPNNLDAGMLPGTINFSCDKPFLVRIHHNSDRPPYRANDRHWR